MFSYVFNFRQEKLIEVGITLEEALVLHWFLMFRETNRMKVFIDDGHIYHWINYKKLKTDLPLIINNEKKAKRLLVSLCTKGILYRKISDNLTFFKINDEAIVKLLTEDVEEKIEEEGGQICPPLDKNGQGGNADLDEGGQKWAAGVDKNGREGWTNLGANNKIINNKINNNNIYLLSKNQNLDTKEIEKVKQIVERWNAFAKKFKLNQVTKITEERKKKILLRLSEKGFDFDVILDRIRTSSFLLGWKNSWRVNFDFIFANGTNWIRIVEGRYHDRNEEDTFLKIIQKKSREANKEEKLNADEKQMFLNKITQMATNFQVFNKEE